MNDCIEYKGTVGSHGYGVFYLTRNRQVLAHRMALIIASGQSPDGRHALHSCNNKLCVNPQHLRWGTHADSMADAARDGLMFAPNAARTHCPHGHAMTEANTIHRTKDGYATRSCRECNRLYLQRRRAARKQEA